ncbi:MAG: 3-oxoadipate enol-lactonase [Rubrobacter sp.]|jgi:3-oxoadipate enol-lactonase|nr:3-oxoadipate enol-lactonase [Rubrobacter sp.]
MEAVNLNYEIEGPEDAPIVVLSSSIGSSLSMWDEQMDALGERFRVLRYDHRGHGKSPVPDGPYSMEELGRDVLSLVDSLGVERFSFCGLSLGGMVGMQIASDAPERVEKLVLCCTAAELGPPSMWDERIEAVKSGGMESLVDAVMERWFTEGFAGNEKVERMRRDFLDTPAEGYAACSAAIRDMDLRDRLPSIKADTLVVSASEDPATPPERGEEIKNAIPNARMAVIPDASHIANVEQPERFTKEVLGHLDG